MSILLTLFATLCAPHPHSATSLHPASAAAADIRATASALILLLAVLAAGESLRTVLEDRRQLSIADSPGGWYSPQEFRAAAALPVLGVGPGDSVACIGEAACLRDFYWARLAGVRILTEIYDPETPVPAFLANLPNRDQAIGVVRAQRAKVLVGDFGQTRINRADPVLKDWQQLSNTTLYALPLNPKVQ